MVLNYIWIGFFLIAFVVSLYRFLILGEVEAFGEVMNSTFSSAKTAFEISLGLTGTLTLWLGLMKIGEAGGVISRLSKAASPVFRRLFPDIPPGHPANGSIFMNISANLLGLDNAATPLGLKAMKELQELNPKKETASNPMIMFLVLNASGLTLIPISIMVYRAQMGAANPADIFIPLMIATLASTLVGVIAVCIKQRIKLADPVLLLFFGGIIAFIVGVVYAFRTLPEEAIEQWSSAIANFILFSIIICFIIAAMRKKVNIYESFIEGAKDGFKTAVLIIPYLVAMLVAIAVFRSCGAMSMLENGIAWAVESVGLDSEFTGALPTALMKPLSGSGARGMMIDAMNTYGADSFVGRLASIFQGSTDTTFYVVAVYYGSVAVRNTRYTISVSLLADLAGIIASIWMAYLFFG